MIELKRAYEPASPRDGARILVDRLWPRGVGKDQLKADAWLREAAPSDELRRWFGHEPARWNAFRQKYRAELRERREALAPLLEAARRGRVTLLYSARDPEHNNAVALREFLQGELAHRKTSPTAPPRRKNPRG